VSEASTEQVPEPTAKPKRKLSAEQLANLAKGRAARAAKRQREKEEAERAQREQPQARLELGDEDPDEDELGQQQELPSIEEVASRTKLYSNNDVLPPPEMNPELRDGISVDVPDFAGDAQKPHTLEDLFAIAPIGDGQYYISVDRRSPKHWGGVQCAGTQRSITRYMTREDFAADYGGGIYTLMLYGPPKRGAMIDPNTGRAKVKALTPPITVTVPVGTYPPNLQAAILDEQHYEDESDMRYGPAFATPARPGNGRPTTTADARMFEAQLSFEERVQQRAEEREKELRQQAAQLPSALTPMVEMLQQQNSQSMQAMQREFAERDRILREQLARERAERERAEERASEQAAMDARRPSETTALGDALSKLLGVMKNDGTKGEEIARLTDAAAKDRERLMQQHQSEIKRITESYESRAKDTEDRADRRIKEAEERADARIRENSERSDRRVNEAKDDAKRQVEDVRTHLNARLEDERRQHDRDLASKNDSWTARLETQKAMYENRISTLAEEITRQRAECERLRKEAEENKDLPAQLQKFASTAELMGWQKESGAVDDEPKDWKSMLGRIGLDLVQQLPQLMESASNTVRAMKSPAVDPAAAQAMQYQQMMQSSAAAQPPALASPVALRGPNGQFRGQMPMAFGSEDGPDFMGRPESLPPIDHRATAAPVASPPIAQQPAPAPVPPPAQAVPPPAPVSPPAPVPASVAQPPAGFSISDEQILQFAPVLAGAFEQGASPHEFAAQFVEDIGAPLARQIAASITPERVAAAIQRKPGGSQNPLVRREGQKFLRELWDAVKKAAG